MVNPVLNKSNNCFPSFEGILIPYKEGSKKFEQWIKQIELAGKKRYRFFDYS